MRRILLALGLVATLGGGCSSAETAAVSAVPSGGASAAVPQVTATQSPRVTHLPEPPRVARSPQARTRARTRAHPAKNPGGFVAAVQAQLPAVALDRRDEEVAELGEEACAGLFAGRSAAAVAGEISGHGLAAADARKLVALAGATAC